MKKQNEASVNGIRTVFSFLIALLHTAAFFYLVFFRYNRQFEAPLYTGGYLIVAMYAAGIGGLLLIMGGFRIGIERMFNLALAHGISIVIVDVISYFELSLIYRAFLPVLPIAIMFAAQLAASALWIYIGTLVWRKNVAVKNMILVYGDKNAEQLVYTVLAREDICRIQESVCYSPGDDLSAVEARILQYDTVLVYRIESAVRNDLLKFCYQNDIEVYLPPRISDIMIRGASEVNTFDSPMISCRVCTLSPEQRFVKRAFDLTASAIALVVLSPLFAVIALSIKLGDRGPVLYKQKRVTENGRVFEIYKFRSMIVDAEKNGAVKATEHDARVTPVGRVLRALRLDELPQLVNILKGDMSVVGPRPERVENHEEYCAKLPEFVFRTKVKAGLTGYAQIMGKYNTSPYDKLLLDLIYIQKFSFFLDLRLILQTIKILFVRESTEGFEQPDNGKDGNDYG